MHGSAEVRQWRIDSCIVRYLWAKCITRRCVVTLCSNPVQFLILHRMPIGWVSKLQTLQLFNTSVAPYVLEQIARSIFRSSAGGSHLPAVGGSPVCSLGSRTLIRMEGKEKQKEKQALMMRCGSSYPVSSARHDQAMSSTIIY